MARRFPFGAARIESIFLLCAATLLAGVLLALVYVAAYCTTGKRTVTGRADIALYSHPWQATLFTPAARIESISRGRVVEAKVERRMTCVPGIKSFGRVITSSNRASEVALQ